MKSSGTTNSGIKQVGVSVQTEHRRSLHTHLLPVVIIAHDTPDLARLMGAYIGRARLALLPDWASATKLIKSLRANHIGILAVLGFPRQPGIHPAFGKTCQFKCRCDIRAQECVGYVPAHIRHRHASKRFGAD